MSVSVPVGTPTTDGLAPFDVAVARQAAGVLREFNLAGILSPADVHAAATLARVLDDARPEVLLATALAVRAPRLGHVCVDLGRVRTTVTAEGDEVGDLDRLPWPDDTDWPVALASSPLVATPEHAGETPLVQAGTRLYLDRYWRYEREVVADVQARAQATVPGIDVALLREGVERLFPAPGRQRLAAATAVLRRLAVIAGGPGTGKTTTVARVIALAQEQARAAGDRPLRVALAAPTGKAAARLEESLREASAAGTATAPEILAGFADLDATTIHRLLGVRPGERTRFRHDRDHPLPHDLVIVDETSMVSLSLMAHLLAAVRPAARLVLVGDPDQLASVEAGAVLGDIVGPASRQLRLSSQAQHALTAASGATLDATTAPAPGIGDGIVVLDRVHRFRRDSGIAALAAAIQRGDADAAVAVLRSGSEDVIFVETAGAPDDETPLRGLRATVAAAGVRLHAAAAAGDAREALARLADLRVLCAHRRGPFGVDAWVPRIERWLLTDVPGYAPAPGWYLARPVLVTRNDPRLGVFNGDIGVAIAEPDPDTEAGRLTVALDGPNGPRTIAPTRLEAVETVHAMTVHKSQGSQFERVVVVLPDPSSPLLTRELLYTAVTRGRAGVTVVGSEPAIRRAVERPIERASGLRDALWVGAAG